MQQRLLRLANQDISFSNRTPEVRLRNVDGTADDETAGSGTAEGGHAAQLVEKSLSWDFEELHIKGGNKRDGNSAAELDEFVVSVIGLHSGDCSACREMG